MRKLIVALILAHFLTIAYTILFAIDEKLPFIKANLFLDKSAMPGGIEIGWYIKYITDHIVWCVTFFVLSRVSFRYHKKMFLVSSMFGVYHLLDFIMFLVNFGQSWWLYYTCFAFLCLGVVILLLPIKEKAKIVTLE